MYCIYSKGVSTVGFDTMGWIIYRTIALAFSQEFFTTINSFMAEAVIV